MTCINFEIIACASQFTLGAASYSRWYFCSACKHSGDYFEDHNCFEFESKCR